MQLDEVTAKFGVATTFETQVAHAFSIKDLPPQTSHA